MIIKNKLEKSFGPFGTSTGIFMFLGGTVATYYTLIGPIIAIIGAFVAFTSESSFIDIENKRIKLSNNLFGFISVGKWTEINPGMKLGLKRTHRGYRAYIRGTQPVNIHNNDIRIYLYGSDKKQILPIMICKEHESAKNELSKLSTLLGLDTL